MGFANVQAGTQKRRAQKRFVEGFPQEPESGAVFTLALLTLCIIAAHHSSSSSQVEKKTYFPLLLITGFVGFDGKYFA